LKREFESLDIDPAVAGVEPMPDERRGGFLALRCAAAGDRARALRARGVFTDFRGALLRLGPAPYLSDDQLRAAVAAFRDDS
jgi:kynureninase